MTRKGIRPATEALLRIRATRCPPTQRWLSKPESSPGDESAYGTEGRPQSFLGKSWSNGMRTPSLQTTERTLIAEAATCVAAISKAVGVGSLHQFEEVEAREQKSWESENRTKQGQTKVGFPACCSTSRKRLQRGHGQLGRVQGCRLKARPRSKFLSREQDSSRDIKQCKEG
ncbi:hypothetical protein FIBSPDRAFT_895388 [Athelia psychrophila]|uniref:Uncharacterized protein n=1 Tax=Athelia psychrophila TaxID=1759441 RepID=A0A166ES01_9AGAM|nr:hypothetical protein FIBSPDRAFT_895388 [Fibularhizoctonia sp. CBS 109695]